MNVSLSLLRLRELMWSIIKSRGVRSVSRRWQCVAECFNGQSKTVSLLLAGVRNGFAAADHAHGGMRTK